MKAIVAMDLNRGIGINGRIPWNITEDLKFFRSMTSHDETGGFVLMGRKTFETVGSLPNRFTYVFTEDKSLLGKNYDSYQYIGKEQNDELKKHWDKLWLCGGAKTYKEFINQCDEVYVSIILDEYDVDSYMPYFEDAFPQSNIIKETNKFWVVRYWK